MANIRFAGKSLSLKDAALWSAARSAQGRHAPYAIRCIDLRAKGVASVRWLDEDDSDITPPPHLLYAIEASLCVSGAAYIIRGDSPRDARVLNPFTMRVNADVNGIYGFTQTVNGHVADYGVNDIVYIHLWHPNSDVHGLAPMDVAGVDVQTALAVSQFTAQFFTDGALPPLIVQPSEGQTITETDTTVMREAWRATVQGVKNMWRAMFTRRRIEIQTLEVPHLSNLAMRDVDEIVLRRIATAFGVPVTMITDAANYATAKEHRLSFWRDTIIPQIRLIASAWADAYGLTIYPDYDGIDALAEQEAEKRDGIVKLAQAGIITPQEARVYLGFDVPEDDKPREGVLTWAEELSKWRRKSEARNVKCAEFESAIIPIGVQSAVKELSETGRDPFAWTRYLPVAAKAKGKEPPFTSDADRFTEAVLKVLIKQGRDIEQIGEEEMMAILADAIRPYIADEVIDSAVANMTAVAGYADVEAIADYAVLWAAQYTYDLVKKIDETTRRALQRIMPTAMREGWTNEQIFDALRPYFNEARARTIAITEITRAYSRGVEISQEILEDYGVKTHLVWRTAADEITCAICRPRDGKRRGRGWDDLPPAHPNCRCWVTIEV